MPEKKKSRSKNAKKEERRVKLREKMTEVLEIPKEIALNMPRLTMVGKGNLLIENYKGIVEYESSRIRVNSTVGTISISGENMVIREITSEDIMVDGEISSLEFMK